MFTFWLLPRLTVNSPLPQSLNGYNKPPNGKGLGSEWRREELASSQEGEEGGEFRPRTEFSWVFAPQPQNFHA